MMIHRRGSMLSVVMVVLLAGRGGDGGFGGALAMAAAEGSSPTGDEVVCGNLAYDGVDSLQSFRNADGTQAWTLAYCNAWDCCFAARLRWVATEDADDAWTGESDYAIWPAETVELGCADETNVLWFGRDASSRVPLLDGNGDQVRIQGRNAWIYELPLPDLSFCSQYHEIYIGVRNEVDAGRSYLATRPCGDKPVFFQSSPMGYPCAIPGREVFGADYCVSVQPEGVCDVDPYCTGNEKIKKLRCKKKCRNGQLRKLTVKVNLIGGDPYGDEGFTVRLDTDRYCQGVLDNRGKAKCRFKDVSPGDHIITATWDCGAVQQKTVTCHDCN